MAELPIRYTYNFKSKVHQLSGDSTYTIQILDSELVGDLNLDFSGDGTGFTIEYPNQDTEFQDPIIPSRCVVPFLIQDAADLAFWDLIKQQQEDRFFIEILRDGSIFWRGVIIQDQIQEALQPLPTQVNLTAFDGLAQLKEKDLKGTFNGWEESNIIERFVYMLTQLSVNVLWADTDEILRTVCQWYEDSMPVGAINPLEYASFKDKNYVYTLDDRGNEIVKPQFQILTDLLQGWNMRIFQAEGKYWCVQVSEYVNSQIRYYGYSKEYRDQGNDPVGHPGRTSSNVALSIEKVLGNYNSGADFQKEAGALYEYLASLKEVRANYDHSMAKEIYKRINFDFTSLTNTFENIAIGSNLGISVFGQHRIKVEDNAATGIYNIQVDLAATVKVGVNYWNGTAWTATPSTITISIPETVEPSVANQLFIVPVSILPDPTPAAGVLELQFVASIQVLSQPTTGTATPVITFERSDITVEYNDPNGNGLIETEYIVKNNLLPDSSLVLDLGDVPLGDFGSSSIDSNHYIIYPNSFSNEWQKNRAGDLLPINLLLCRELMHQRKRPIKKLEFAMRGPMSPLWCLTFDSSRFILAGGTFTARMEQFDGTFLELNYIIGNTSDEVSDDNGDDDQNATFKTNTQQNVNVNDRVRWRGEYVDGDTYVESDQSQQNGWTMIANKTTTDQPAPVLIGIPEFTIDNTIAWEANSHTDYVISGNKYTFTQGGFITAVRVYIPETDIVNTDFVVRYTNVTTGEEIFTPQFQGNAASSWQIVSITTALVAAGAVVQVDLIAFNSSSTTSWTWDWRFAGTDNNNNPNTGDWNSNTQNNILRIHDEDNGGTDRSTDLANVVPQTIIRIEDKGNANNFIEYEVDTSTDNGTSYTFDVIPRGLGGTITAGTLCTINATIPQPDTTDYVSKTNHWTTLNEPVFASVTGVLQLGNGTPTESANAYGTDIQFQQATASEDWEFVAYTDLAAATSSASSVEGIINITSNIAVSPTNDGAVIYMDPTGGNIIETLPNALLFDKKTFTFKRVINGNNYISLSPATGEKIDAIDDTSALVLGTAYDVVTLRSDAGRWNIVQDARTAVGVISLATPTTQAITTAWGPLTTWDTNQISTPGRITADQANDRITVDIIEGAVDIFAVDFNISFEYSNNIDLDFCLYVDGVSHNICVTEAGRGVRVIGSGFTGSVRLLAPQPKQVQVYVKADANGTLDVEYCSLSLNKL